MDSLLTAVKTINRESQYPLVAVETQTRNDASIESAVDLSQDISSQQVVQILKSHLSNDELAVALAALDPFNKSREINDLDIRIPGPTTAQILQILVSTTIPNHWASLNGKDSTAKDARCRAALLRCLSSIAGIGSLVAQLRTLIASSRAAAHKADGQNNHVMIRDLLSVLAVLLEPKDFLHRIYNDIVSLQGNRNRQQVAWKEFVSLVAAGKILSMAAEALTIANASELISSVCWIGDGPRYATWLGGNIAYLASKIKDDVNDWASIALLTGRALSLGYADQLVREIVSGLLFEQLSPAQFGLLVDHLRQPEQVALLEAIFRDLQKKYFSDDLSAPFKQSDPFNNTIAGVAALCKVIIGDRPFLKDQIMSWLSKSQGGSIQTIGLRRALLAIYNDSTDMLKSLLARSLEQFGDKLFIKHVPTVIQNTNAQTILLAAGQLKRLDPLEVHEIGRTSVFLNAISNRLAASSNRARFLGMIVGTGISQLIEEPGKAMKFDLEEMQSEEALWYLSLTRVHDKAGPIEAIKMVQKAPSETQQATKGTQRSQNQKRSAPSNRPPTSKIVAIEEIDDSEEETDEDGDLLPYEKPDEDAEDEDEDPTLIQRNKAGAPIYIRDLISYLRDTENVERYHLAISTAPSLIRRKTGFGTELAEQVEELALTLVSLQNDNNHPSFHESRLQSMIALIVSQPLKMGRWFTAIFFDGDLSQVQRSAVLTALGLSAREIAGNGEEDAKALNLPTLGDTSFPSKRLSPALEAVFMGANESPIATLTREMSRTSLQPLAADAADRMTGPNALKVRTFSSRMEVEKKRQQRQAQRQKNVVEDVHKVLADGFFYPLQGRFEIMLLQFASSSAPSHNPFLVPHILTLFLQTLSLIFSTAGPYNPSLPGFTHETLSLLLSLHTAPIASEPTVTAALLSLFLAVVDVNIASGSNGEERLVTEHATRVMELREWASEVFDRMPSGSGKADSGSFADPQEQVRTLAAGVMVRLGEVIERYQGRLMGVNSGFKY
ncbi:DNA replication checkpoint protein tel2 [Penicillium rolfsii]|nr:DNA replication checkpoint protein tel2 [Penicillium rolfsii]